MNEIALQAPQVQRTRGCQKIKITETQKNQSNRTLGPYYMAALSSTSRT
jgi:hypothetical protein